MSTNDHKSPQKCEENRSVDFLCDALDISILAPRIIPSKPRQTRARQTLNSIKKKFGEGHLVLTLKCITDSGNEKNANCLSADVIMAVSDVLIANPHYDQFGTDLLDAFAEINLCDLRKTTSHRFRAHLRLRLETLIALELDRILGDIKKT